MKFFSDILIKLVQSLSILVMYRFGGIFCVDNNTHTVLIINGLYSLFLALEYFLFHWPLLRPVLLFSHVSYLSVDPQVTVGLHLQHLWPHVLHTLPTVFASSYHILDLSLGVTFLLLQVHPLVSCAWIFACNTFSVFYLRGPCSPWEFLRI